MRRSSRASAAVVVLALAGCGAPATPTASPTLASTEVRSVEVLIAGDSLASGGPWDAMPNDPGSWTYYLDDVIEVTGGWWRDGATSGLVADRIRSSRGEVLIVMLGTNDVRQLLPVEDIPRNIVAIVSKVEVTHVVVAAIPPEPRVALEVSRANAALEATALARGWTFIDPWGPFRSGDGWSPGASTDEVHGTTKSYNAVGEAISVEVLRLVAADWAP